MRCNVQQAAENGEVLGEEEHLHDRLVRGHRPECMEDRRDCGREEREEQGGESRPVPGGERKPAGELDDAHRVDQQAGERHVVGLHRLDRLRRMGEELVCARHDEHRGKRDSAGDVGDVAPAVAGRGGNSVTGCIGLHGFLLQKWE